MSQSQMRSESASAPFDLLAREGMWEAFRYFLPVVAVAIAIGVTTLLDLSSPEGPNLFPFFVAVAVSAWFCGSLPGWLSVVLSTTAVDYFFIPPVHVLDLSAKDIPWFVTFAGCSVLTNALSLRRRRAEALLILTRDELDVRVRQRQSLNEELSALNGQLQETLDRQRTTTNDLQNILYSTDVATLFLDADLNIRFFTPATKSLFTVISSDIGRSISDLRPLVPDGALVNDAKAVLTDLASVEHEIEAPGGTWYLRRIHPYRTQDNRTEGVVITFVDISERKHTSDALTAAKREAERASAAKSRFLAAASHDLRQPLQTLSLIRGLLERKVRDNKTADALKLIERLDESADAMSGMLNTLLDVNQIESGTVNVNVENFPINDLLDRLKEEFSYHAQAHKLGFNVVSSGLWVSSDVRLLDQMLRNLLSNALKYTKHGKVLLGCRRHEGMLSIQVCDTGPGIPEGEFKSIFEEYHQLDNAARERSRGLGLGLSIVGGLGKLLGHRVHVESQLGKGSVFTVEVTLSQGDAQRPHDKHSPKEQTGVGRLKRATILIVDDDPDVRELLELFLKEGGYHTITAADGVSAMALVTRGDIRPDLILADYNLPKDMDGLVVGAKLREIVHCQIPVVILTGDISTGTLRNIARFDCVTLRKPVKLTELSQTIERLLPAPAIKLLCSAQLEAPKRSFGSVVFVVDDDNQVCEAMRAVLEDDGHRVETYSTSEAFLEAYRPDQEGCLLLDAYLPGLNGIELLRQLYNVNHRLPVIMITGNSEVPMAVRAMKAGAVDFIEKPIGREDLLAGVNSALEKARDSNKLHGSREAAAKAIDGLTTRQHQIMDLVLAGHPSKNIAADLGISQRTVENHRAAIMEKTGSKSLPALARLALAAHRNDPLELPT
jgi:two-component system CheB/CheR fusion protein